MLCVAFAMPCHQLCEHSAHSLSRFPNYNRHYSTYVIQSVRSVNASGSYVCYSSIRTSLLCVHLISSGDSGKLMIMQVKLTVEPASMYKSGPPSIFVIGSVIGIEQIWFTIDILFIGSVYLPTIDSIIENPIGGDVDTWHSYIPESRFCEYLTWFHFKNKGKL